MVNLGNLYKIKTELAAYSATLVAVSKMKSEEDIQIVYDAGQKDFGENYVQELCSKKAVLPQDIRWHFIGHLQSNKVRQIVPFITLIHGVDHAKLLAELDKQAEKAGRTVECLLQIYIAEEETKFGLDEAEADEVLADSQLLKHVKISGFMGMATNTDNEFKIRREFSTLYKFYERQKSAYNLSILSMGMTSDYKIALDCGSNMVRIGSAIFGERTTK